MIGTFYRPGRTFLHRFDPRCKLVLLLLFVVLFLLPLRLAFYAGCLLAVVLLILAGLKARELLPPLRLIGAILLLVVVLTPPLHRQGPVYVRVLGWPLLTAAGVRETVRLLLRLAGITLAFFVFLRTTSPEELLLSLRWFGLPFHAVLALQIALQYIPTVGDLYLQVVEAHRLRRCEQGPLAAGRRRLRRTVKELLPVLTSILILAIRRITLLAMALELRGVGLKTRRTSYATLPAGRSLLRDALIAAAIAGAALAAAVVFT